MKQIVLNVKDERKLEVLLSLLKDLSYVEIENNTAHTKVSSIPKAMLSPEMVLEYRKINREELYDRQ